MTNPPPQVHSATAPQPEVFILPAVGPMRSLVYMVNALLTALALLFALASRPIVSPSASTHVPADRPTHPSRHSLTRATRRRANSSSPRNIERRVNALLNVVLCIPLRPQQAYVWATAVLRPLAIASIRLCRAHPSVDAFTLNVKLWMAARKLYVECIAGYMIAPAVGGSHLAQQL